jgi:Family of unknown function (DUF5675)
MQKEIIQKERILTLTRIYSNTRTVGHISDQKGNKICDTLELMWNYNIKKHSCIKEGIYQIRKIYSQKYKRYVILLENVSGRFNILIHAANYISELTGSMAPGIYKENDFTKIVASKRYLDILMSVIESQKITHLKITSELSEDEKIKHELIS